MNNSEKHHRRSIRLKEYDYSQNGAYFVTICTHNSKCLFGNVVDGKMRLSRYGQVVMKEWNRTAKMRINVKLDLSIVMPNHFHAIIVLDDCRGVLQYAPTKTEFRSPSQTVGAIIRGFKASATNKINVIRNTPGFPVWQRNYWEHVIRDEDKLFKIRQYIQNNPIKWHLDRENPEKVGKDLLEEEIFNLKMRPQLMK